MNIHIQFRRVQSWLFSVPRLRAMIGANILLGELLRIDLKDLALNSGGRWQLQPIGADISHPAFAALARIDPLDSGVDTPARDANEGILARDGGHFIAQFTTQTGARAFVQAAKSLIHQKCPGLEYRISATPGDSSKSKPFIARQSTLSLELPVFSQCEWSGHGLGSTVIAPGTDPVITSLETEHRWKASQKKSSKDLASLVLRSTYLKETEQIPEFKDFAAGGYLAVIHADGNGMGAALAGCDTQESIAFFYHNRVLMRAALQRAINTVRRNNTEKDRPLEILMLGGDDLLLVCQANLALALIIELCKALQILQTQHPPIKPPFTLTLGIGAVITRPTIPFNRLHELAEMLAASAKRKARKIVPSASIVDWSIYTSSLLEDITTARQRDWLCPDSIPRILSRRPLHVLGDGCDSLEGLVTKAQALPTKVSRSQLRFLLDQLGKGEHLAELAFAELAPETKLALKSIGISKVWEPLNDDAGSEIMQTTALMDLIETFEIPRLGRTVHSASSTDSSSTRPAHV